MMKQPERLTVVERNPDNGKIVRRLFTGTRVECESAMQFLFDDKRWPVDRISLVESQG